MNISLKPVGTITELHRYIVKSMAGEALPQCELGWNGFALDRRYAFVQSQLLNGFPWFTARQLPALLQYQPRVLGGNSSSPDVLVRTPDERELALDSSELHNVLQSAFGKPIHLQCIKRGIFDAAPLSLISEATVQALAASTGVPVDARRFRPNIVVRTLEALAFEEDTWVGATLVFGDRADAPAMAVSNRDPRCSMINLDPNTVASAPAVLKTVSQQHEGCAGVYGSVFAVGELRVGDAVYLKRA